MNTKQDGLEPCPFCGGVDILVKKRRTTFIECADCGALMLDYQDGVQRDVIAAWNRRSASTKEAASAEPKIPATYVRNCAFIGWRQNEPPLFHAINDVVYASLDGYVILPTEEFAKYRLASDLTPPSPITYNEQGERVIPPGCTEQGTGVG